MTKPVVKKTVINKAIKQAGGVMAVASEFEYAFPSAIYNWLSRGIPVECAMKLAKMKGVTVTAKQMRPDVF